MPAANASPNLDWLITAQYTTWVLVLMGWLLNEGLNRGRDNRKETRSQIDDLRKSIDELAALGMTYYTSKKPGDSAKTEADIKIKVKRMFFSVQFTASKLGVSLDKELSKFDECLTGGSFESSERETLTYASDEVLRIGLNANELVSSLENGFLRKHGRPFYKRLCD